MSLPIAINVVLNFFNNTMNKPGTIVGATKNEDGWTLKVEVVEESEYLVQFGRDELLAIYEVRVNEALEIIHYKRESLRERGSLDFNPVEK